MKDLDQRHICVPSATSRRQRHNVIDMAWSPGKVPRNQPGLARKAMERGAARLAACADANERVADVVYDCPTPSGCRTSPCCASPKSNWAGATGASLLTDNSSQLIAESQSLLSPGNSPTPAKRGNKGNSKMRGAGSAATLAPPAESVIHVETGGVPTESQLTMGSNFQGLSSGALDNDFAGSQDGSDSDSSSSKSSSSGDAADPDDAAEHGDVDAEEFEKFINNNDNENDDVDVGAMNEGLDDLNDYSSDRFSINERVSYFMDRAPITTTNRAAVEFVYMIEAETLTRGSGTRGLDDVKKLLHSKYISLIRQIPSGHFAEFGLREKMIEKYYGAKTGGPSGLYTKVLDVKKKVQAVTCLIDGIGTPLSKIPSGRRLNNVRRQFILNDYKAMMGEVSQYFSGYHFSNCKTRSQLLGLH